MATFHCFFEQSGTFKNEFKKLGQEAYDYDIQDEFGETDYVIDLFNEIRVAYDGLSSIFDKISQNDTILAFFPCTRFEEQIIMGFRGELVQQGKWNNEKKLEYCLKLHSELNDLYELITKMVIVCIRKNLKLIIENPYGTQHYLTRYWCLKPSVLDLDRTNRGDFYKKPTQYWFINCEPRYNFIFEAYKVNKRKAIENTHNKTERSMISKEYANRFIREFILEE